MAYNQESEYALLGDLLSRLDNRIVVDVGAEKGSFVDASLSAGSSHVYACEPYPPHVAHLRQRFRDSPDVTVLDVAIAAEDGSATLHVAHDPAGQPLDYHHSLVAFADSPEVRWSGAVTVIRRSLDSLVRDGTLPRAIGLLKIDTEGGDLFVLQGMGDLQSAVVTVEYWEGLEASIGTSPYRPSDLVALLGARGFHDFVFVKRHDEFEVMDVGATRTRAGDWGNFVFVHEGVRDRLMPVVRDAAAAAQEQLVNRALWFREECRKRMDVITGFEAQRVAAQGQARPASTRESMPGPWVAPAPPGENERLRSGAPTVTIVTPSFNQARFLEQTLRSVLDQGYPNLEYIVIDGGSTDGCVEIIQRYSDRLAYWVSEPDHGQADALNKGMARATGDIVAWINSDDFYVPGAIAAAVSAFAANPDAGLVYGRGNRVDDRGHTIGEFESTRPFDLDALVHGVDYILQPTTFMRRQALHEVGPLDPDLHYAFDWDLWIRLGSRFPATMLDQLLAASREYTATKTASGGFRRTEEIRHLVLRHTGKEMSVGYLNYFMHTVLEMLPAAEIPDRSRLETAVKAVLHICQELLSEDWLRTRESDSHRPRREIRPLHDNWAGPELRLRRMLPATAEFVCLTGVHDQGVAQVAGPLTLWISLNGQPLGMGVVVEPGPFALCWRLPEALREQHGGRSCDVSVATATSLVASRFWPTDDQRSLSFRFVELSFDTTPPAGAEVMPEGWPSATDAVISSVAALAARKSQRLDDRPGAGSLDDGTTPAPRRREIGPHEDGWAGPELRLQRVMAASARFLCVSGIHDQAVAQIAGPLTLWVSVDEQPLGMGVVAVPGPFILCWRLPDAMRARHADQSCEAAVATATSLVASRFWPSEDTRALSFRLVALSFEDQPPEGAEVMPEGWPSATDAIARKLPAPHGVR